MKSLQLDGKNEVIGRLASALIHLQGLSADGVQLVALDIKGRAVEKAPKDSGELRRNVSVEVQSDGVTAEATISFNTSYAAKQHEELGYKHKEGEAKFLEKAAHEVLEVVREKVAEQMQSAFDGLGG